MTGLNRYRDRRHPPLRRTAGVAWHWRQLIVSIALALAVPLPVHASIGLGEERAWEVITVEGRQFPAAFHVSVHQLSLLRVSDGVQEPIPFQIDERDRSGRFALPDGPDASRDEDPGVFDDNDLLVFLVRDLGERTEVQGAAAIRVTDPLNDRSGWVYLKAGTPTPPTAYEAVRYDPKLDAISAQRYILEFGPHTTTYFAFVSPEGKPTRNLLDRVKARITVRLLGGVLTFHRNEQDITSHVIAWKDGPIRAIRRARLTIHVGYGLPHAKVIAESIFTGDTFDAPATVQIPFKLRYVLGSLTLRTFMDFSGVTDLRIFTAGHPPALLACGQPVPPVDGLETDWFGMTGPEGTFVQNLRLSPKLAAVRRQLYAVADPRPDPPERVPGDCPGVGYTLTNWQGITGGSYWSETIVRAFAHYSARDIQAFLYSTDHPLEVAVNPDPRRGITSAPGLQGRSPTPAGADLGSRAAHRLP